MKRPPQPMSPVLALLRCAAPRCNRTRAAIAAAVATLAEPLMSGSASASVNSYRFMHVTIDTPWHIFLFLLIGIFAPFILMVVLMWRNSARKRGQANLPGGSPPKA